LGTFDPSTPSPQVLSFTALFSKSSEKFNLIESLIIKLSLDSTIKIPCFAIRYISNKVLWGLLVW
jgi:hypothetical protein